MNAVVEEDRQEPLAAVTSYHYSRGGGHGRGSVGQGRPFRGREGGSTSYTAADGNSTAPTKVTQRMLGLCRFHWQYK